MAGPQKLKIYQGVTCGSLFVFLYNTNRASEVDRLGIFLVFEGGHYCEAAAD